MSLSVTLAAKMLCLPVLLRHVCSGAKIPDARSLRIFCRQSNFFLRRCFLLLCELTECGRVDHLQVGPKSCCPEGCRVGISELRCSSFATWNQFSTHSGTAFSVWLVPGTSLKYSHTGDVFALPLPPYSTLCIQYNTLKSQKIKFSP